VSIIGTIAFIAFFVYIGFHFHSSNDRYLEPQKRNFSIELNTACNDNIQNGESYKLLVVSDLHLGYIINKEALKKYVSVINAQNADIIVIAGDLIDFYLEPLEIQKMDEDLKCLYAPHGVYFIPGNHEYKIDAEIDLEWIRKTGITVLRDSVANIGSKLQLIGRDDRKNKENRMAWNDLMIQTDSSKAQILIAHNPKDINEVADIPLVICGHSHNGQVFPINFLCRILYPNSYGFKRKGNVCTYTTSGIGLSGFPLRICSESELVIFNVEIK
jgi:predicted MPP superfamily phosphohydrolase